MEWAWSYHDGNRDGDAGDGDGGDGGDLQQPVEPDDQEVAMSILDTRRSPRR